MRDPNPFMDDLFASVGPFFQFMEQSTYFKRNKDDTDIADFVFGNPHELPLAGISQALTRSVQPAHKDWFAYKMSEPESVPVVAASLQKSTGLPFAGEDIFMTNGAFAGLSVVLRTIVRPDDEVIFLSPPWFFYELLIRAVYGKARRVLLSPPRFDLDLERIAAAITTKTRAVILNSPHNPSGRVYSDADLARLADLLRDASKRIGHPIYLLSDEAYRRIVYDGRDCPTPARHYADTFVIYTYGKTLLAPGQRIGYVALPPAMPDKAELRRAMLLSQFATGWAFPNADMQYALAELEGLCVDIAALQRRRDHFAQGLRAAGYEVIVPEGTFYMLVRTPIADDVAFSERLAQLGTFVLPGTNCELPGYVRISLTANDAMVERGLRDFTKVGPGVRSAG
jgi:aspartate aminotransferase